MGLTTTFVVELMLILLVNAKIVKRNENSEVKNVDNEVDFNDVLDDNFNGVYSECFLSLSYPCVQRKTLMYLNQLNNLSEVTIIGDYVKFVKLNTTKNNKSKAKEIMKFSGNSSEELTHLIDKAIDRFFENYVIRISAIGRDLSVPNNVEEFVGRKKRKGGGGGGGGGGHGGDDGGKRKMMMMAMMCMKMKLMMMIPAMMGMMGMMSFKGMMFSMMSFMLSKMMLLMKLLEKKGGAGGGLGGGGDGGWAAGGAGGGAWMPAGGQDYAGGGGGGYDANGQWQGRSIIEPEQTSGTIEHKPMVTYVDPIVKYATNDKTKSNPDNIETFYHKPIITYANPIKIYSSNNMEAINNFDTKKGNNLFGNESLKSRRKRSIIDVLQNSYMYWMNKFLGINNNRRTSNVPKYKMVNGVKYVFYPYRQQKVKVPKEIQSNRIKSVDEGFKPIITAEDFNKGEIMEGAVESRMNRKKMNKMKETVNDTLDDNPWE